MALLFFSILFNLTPLPPQKNKKNLVFFIAIYLKKEKSKKTNYWEKNYSEIVFYRNYL